MAKSYARQEAEKLCRMFPKSPSKTLARRLSKEAEIPIENARNLIRAVRGNIGNRSRKDTKDKECFRENGQSGTKPSMPPSLASPWMPVQIDNKETVAVLSDVHIPFHHETALITAVKYCKSRKPDTILINGDWGDWYAISRFVKNPKRVGMVEELEAQREGFEWLRSEFPKARIIYKLGNHDERWNHWLWNHAPEICDLPEMQLNMFLKTKEMGIEYIQDGRPVMAGGLPIFHGHELQNGAASPVNIAKSVFAKMTDTALVGHGHKTSQHIEPNWKHEVKVTYSTGCLCDMSPEYARINKWNWGFAIVNTNNGDDVEVENIRIENDFSIRRG